MPLPDSEQFKEFHTVRGVPVRILNEQGLGELVGKKAKVHMHTPATQQLGRPIYSVLVNDRVVGQAEDIYLKNTKMMLDKGELKKHRENPSGKTRNTFVSGTVHPVPVEGAEKPLKIRPGLMVDSTTGEDVSTGMAGTRLGPHGTFYK